MPSTTDASAPPPKAMTGIEEAVQKAGGRRALGEMLRNYRGKARKKQQRGVSEQAVAGWLEDGGVTIERAAEIEELLGIDRKRLLRPDIAKLLYPDL